ncbi:MAG TPA: Ku protein [Acidimicrobiales bacterium]|nr:Ku protein [Acidimicrobiales bacterium]
MARAIWSGAVSFGLVNIPVKVYSAARDHGVHFHQVDKKSGSRIRYEKVAEKTGKQVDSDQIELGYEVDKGKMVVVDPGELDELRPRTTRTIDITDFVELSEVDPVYYNRTYWLVPDGEAASRAYRLLVAAMEDRDKAGIGMVVMRNKQYLAAIRPREHALALSTMRFADEIVARADLDGLPSKSSKPDTRELKLANQIIDSLSGPWKPERYHDTYTEEVRELIKAHEKGKDIVVEEAPAARAETTDLMQALEASLKAARSRGSLEPALEKMAAELSADDDEGDDEGDGSGSSKAQSGSKASGSRSKKAPAQKAHSKRAPASKRSSSGTGSSKSRTTKGSRSAA